MQNVSKTICQAFKDARRALGLSQSVLADEIGCHQEAISMFERGNATKLSEEYVSKIAKRLGIDIQKLQDEEESVGKPAEVSVSVGYCPECECPSNSSYTVGGRSFYRITLQKGIYCSHCGEVLEKRCPSCGAALNEGACCTMCGSRYIT
ncbi:MAG: helix-turn-helix domain-containing protein [Kiritimatiellae bacterium]|nr:helix-turn-helix domain-containing protein [Kiritimatiellia bacterium]